MDSPRFRFATYLKLPPETGGFVWSDIRALEKILVSKGFTECHVRNTLALRDLAEIHGDGEIVIVEAPRHDIDGPPYNSFTLFYKKAEYTPFTILSILPEVANLTIEAKRVKIDKIDQEILNIEDGEYQGPSKKEVNEAEQILGAVTNVYLRAIVHTEQNTD